MALAATRELLLRGVADGLQLGGQLFASRDGSILEDWAFGERLPGEPMGVEDLMLWLSATKPVTALSLAQLWERDLLSLDDPVAAHIPEFAAGGKEAVTIRHLLTHTGGIRMLGTGWPDAPWEEIVERICARKLEPRWRPGRKAGYHLSSSWFILGELIQRLDGRPFADYVREEVFERAEMTTCWIGMPRPVYDQLAPRLAPVFDTEHGARPHGWEAPERVTRASPGSNGRGPMRELARLYENLLGRGGGRPLLRSQTVEALTARHRVGLFDHTFRHVLDWGLGFVLDSTHYQAGGEPYGYGELASPRVFGHSGYRSTVAFADPEHDLAVALAVNGTPSEERHRQRFHELLTTLYRDLEVAAR